MKKITYGLVLTIIVATFGLYSQAANRGEQQCLSTAMVAAGVQVQEISINGWAELDQQNYPDEVLPDTVSRAMHLLGAKEGEYNLTTNTSKYHYTVRADKVASGYHAVVMAQVLYGVSQNKPREVYLVINIESINGEDTPKSYEKKVSEIITDIGGSPRITTCLVGWFDGKLDKDHWAGTINKAFKAIDAKVVDSVVNANFVSYTGYTPNVGDGLKVGDQRVNVHMAMRYSPYDDRTYITIGSPVIIREY